VKERYETWADRELLGPLGMTDSNFGFRRQDGSTADLRLSCGHRDDLTPGAVMPFATRPAGQFTTTATDMAHLTQFLMGDGQIGGQTFIQPALLNAMGRAHGTFAAEGGYSLEPDLCLDADVWSMKSDANCGLSNYAFSR